MGDVTALFVKRGVYQGALDLVVESLSRRELLRRTAACMGTTTQVLGLPLFIGFTLPGLRRRCCNPP